MKPLVRKPKRSWGTSINLSKYYLLSGFHPFFFIALLFHFSTIAAALFGVIAGLFGAMIGSIGAIFGVLLAAITFPFRLIFGWHEWDFGVHWSPVTWVVLLIIAALIVRRSNK